MVMPTTATSIPTRMMGMSINVQAVLGGQLVEKQSAQQSRQIQSSPVRIGTMRGRTFTSILEPLAHTPHSLQLLVTPQRVLLKSGLVRPLTSGTASTPLATMRAVLPRFLRLRLPQSRPVFIREARPVLTIAVA